MTSPILEAMERELQKEEINNSNGSGNGACYKIIDGPVSEIIPKSDGRSMVRIGRGLEIFFVLPLDAEVKKGDRVTIEYNGPGDIYHVLNLDVHGREGNRHYENQAGQGNHYTGEAA